MKYFVKIGCGCFLQSSGAGGKTSQEIIEDLASDILSKLPLEFNLEETKV